MTARESRLGQGAGMTPPSSAAAMRQAGRLPDKVVLVTPWFGNRNGGAEVFCAGLARALQGIGRPVEVLTTCCRDPFHDWSENSLPAGPTELEGIPVRRFPVRPRNAGRYAELSGKLQQQGRLTGAEEEDLLRNSINSDALLEHLASHRSAALYFFLPYLYGTTVAGVRECLPEHAFLIPCLHNEPFAYLEIIQETFGKAAGCLFLSPPERDFASALYRLEGKAQEILGGGLDRTAEGQADRFRQRTGLDSPFLLSVGRKVAGKGADLLLNHFGEYLAQRPEERDLHLVLIGSGELEVPADLRSRVHSWTAASGEEVYDAMAACDIFIQPSFLESFSLVLMEAWLHRKPAMVNGQCEVTTYHALKANGGLYFTSFAEFSECLQLLRSRPMLAQRLGQNGEAYVLRNYLWPDTALRFQRFLDRLGDKTVDIPEKPAPAAAALNETIDVL